MKKMKGWRKLIAFGITIAGQLGIAGLAVAFMDPVSAGQVVSQIPTAMMLTLVGFCGGNVGEHWSAGGAPEVEAPIFPVETPSEEAPEGP